MYLKFICFFFAFFVNLSEYEYQKEGVILARGAVGTKNERTKS